MATGKAKWISFTTVITSSETRLRSLAVCILKTLRKIAHFLECNFRLKNATPYKFISTHFIQ